MSELESQIEHPIRERESLAVRGVSSYSSRLEYDMDPSYVHDRYGDRSAEELEKSQVELRLPRIPPREERLDVCCHCHLDNSTVRAVHYDGRAGG